MTTIVHAPRRAQGRLMMAERSRSVVRKPGRVKALFSQLVRIDSLQHVSHSRFTCCSAILRSAVQESRAVLWGPPAAPPGERSGFIRSLLRGPFCSSMEPESAVYLNRPHRPLPELASPNHAKANSTGHVGGTSGRPHSVASCWCRFGKRDRGDQRNRTERRH